MDAQERCGPDCINTVDLLSSDIRDILPCAASRRVLPPEGRSPRDVWDNRRPHLRRSQNDELLCVFAYILK